MSIPNHVLIPALVAALVVWRVYRRVRRNIGRQRFRPYRLWLRSGIFGLVSGLIATATWGQPPVLLGFGIGMLAGLALAGLGLRLTRFETTVEGRFYTPNTYLGLALSLLMVGRLAYRLALLYGPVAPPDKGVPPQMLQSPLTLGIAGVLAGYYLAYYIGVLVQCRKLQPALARDVGIRN